MKQITISEENWKKLSHMKTEYMLKSFDGVVTKLMSETQKQEPKEKGKETKKGKGIDWDLDMEDVNFPQ